MVLSDREWISKIRRLTIDQQTALLHLIEVFAAPDNHIAAEPPTVSTSLQAFIGLFDEQSSHDIKLALRDLEQIDPDEWR